MSSYRGNKNISEILRENALQKSLRDTLILSIWPQSTGTGVGNGGGNDFGQSAFVHTVPLESFHM